MPYNQDHYNFDKHGNYISAEEAARAADNGHLTRTSKGYWDRETGEEFWEDGEKI